jgi:shikimate kinase
MSIPEIFEKKGEAYFRKCETRLLFSIMQISPRVVSCGGGIVLNEMNVNQMREVGTIVLLTATPETIYERVKGNKDRPLLKGRLTVKGIEKLMNERKEAYENAADVVIPTDGLTPNDVAQRIEAAISPRA